MSPAGVELQTIEKVGEKVIEANATDLGLQRIAMRDLETLPKGVETDVFRSLQYIPGVQSTGDISAKYYVRGGASNQNLVLLDGVTVYNPFHALGLFSVLDPEMINSAEFYKGGFPAEYGGRLSSVMNLITKDGNKNRLSGSASGSFLTGKALIEGPIPDGSFIATGRMSYSNQILKKFLNDKTLPFNFYDLSVKLNYSNPDFIEGSKFSINSFFSSDLLEDKSPYREDFRWENNLLGFKWFQVYDSPLFSELSLSMSNFQGEVIPKFSQAKPRFNEIKDVTLGMDFTYIFDNNNELWVGLNFQSFKSRLNFENSVGIGSDISSQAGNISTYIKYKFLQFDNLGLDVGSRINLTGLSKYGNFTFEPRASLTYRFIPQMAFKAAWGIYQQEITTISDENEVISLFEPYVVTPDYLNPSTAIHYIAGLETDFFTSLAFDVEVYYKKLHNITALNENKRFEDDPDLVAGTGESYGLELMLKFNQDPISFQAAYSLSWAYKEVEGWLYYPRYDSRNSVSLTFEYNLGGGWRATTAWFYNTGMPNTPLIGFYDKFYFGDLFNDTYIYESYSPYAILGDKNYGRLPDYHRLDLNLSKKFELFSVEFYLDLNILNVYDRENIFYYERDTGKRVNMLPFLPTAALKIVL